jgi:hypothetical protein
MTRTLTGLLLGAGLLLSTTPVAQASALPDDRVYEQVSPALKSGGDAGTPDGVYRYVHATADGNGLLYFTRGAMGDAVRGLQEYTVGHRTADGWSARSALPPFGLDHGGPFGHNPLHLLPSADLSKLVFGAASTYGYGNPGSPTSDPPETASGALYLGDANKSATWLTQPQTPSPVPAPGHIGSNMFQVLGGSPDLSTVYFWGLPTLLPSDAGRAGTPNWGVYEYSGGTLKSAGTLPDGSEDPGGAGPAASNFGVKQSDTAVGPERTVNQVSRDGSTLWFVTPDPGANPVFGPPKQLYVRRAGHSTLVSRMPDGSAAPNGVVAVPAFNGFSSDSATGQQFAFGAADGSGTIFQSVDALAAGAPNDASVKSYRYDVATDAVTYLPGVGGASPVAASDDAQRFLFGNFTRIGVWDHGTVKSVAAVGSDAVAPARASASGSSFVFESSAPIPGFNNGGVQVYRYDVIQDRLSCLSCAPDGASSSSAVRRRLADLERSQPRRVIHSRHQRKRRRRVLLDDRGP